MQGIELLNLLEVSDEPPSDDEAENDTELLPEPEIVTDQAFIPVPVSPSDNSAAQTDAVDVVPAGPPRIPGTNVAS